MQSGGGSWDKLRHGRGEPHVRRKRAGAVRLSDHAYERWKLRVAASAKQTSVAARIRRRIAAELKNGAEVNRNGALEIKVMPGVWAICYPSFMGGWEVATIIREGWDEYMEERAIYGGNGEDRLLHAIEYFENAIKESDEIIADCSDALKAEFTEQKECFVVALEAMKSMREAEQEARRTY